MTFSTTDLVNMVFTAFLLITVAASLVYAGRSTHPYETCTKRHSDPLSVSECVWILTEGD